MKFKDGLQREIYYRSQIDYCYFVFAQWAKLPDGTKVNGILDRTSVSISTAEMRKSALSLFACIIRCKKKLGYGTERDEAAREQVRKLKFNL